MHKFFLPLFLTIIIAASPGCMDKKARDKKAVTPVPYEGIREVADVSVQKLRPGIRGGSIIRADIQELDTFNPVITRSRSVYAVLKLVFDSLLSIHPLTGEIQGGIAKEYSIINNGYSLLLSLNTDIRFSDGVLCTADDILYTFEEIYLNPDVDSKKGNALKIRDKLIRINKIDDLTIRIDLPVPYRPFLYTLANIQILPKHILQPLIEKNGIEAFNKTWGSIDGGIHNVIGTGPYTIKEMKKGEYIKLERNPYFSRREGGLYLKGMPYIDEIIELLNVDNETKLLKFQIGEIDFYDIKDIDIENGDLGILQKNKAEGKYRIYSGGQTLKSNHFLAFNQKPEALDKEKLSIFKNVLFRKAVSHCIDRENIVNEVYHGYAYMDASPERDVSPFHRNIKSNTYSVQAAKDLLATIPLKDSNGDGFLDLPSGSPFSFTILTNDDNPFRVKMAEIITASLNEAGLNVDYKATNYDVIVTKLLDIFDWDAVILGLEGSIEPNDASWIWESKGSLHLWCPYQESPHTDWEKRIDELFALGRTTWDLERAKEYYNEYQEIAAQQLPLISIVIPAELYGFRTGYGNVIPCSVTYNTLGLMPYLYIEKKR